MADEVFRGRKDPGGSETSWSQLSCFCGFWKVQGSKVRSSKLISVPSALHDPADLERLLTTLKGSAGRPQIRMGQAKIRPPQRKAGAALGFLPRRCSQRPGGLHTQDSLGGGILVEVTRRHTSTGRPPELRCDRFVRR